jgi:hypothetical protein
MSAFARGAAGWLHVERARLRRRTGETIRQTEGDLETFVLSLMKRFNIPEARARELAAEQQTKIFNRAPSGARR